MAPKTMLPPDWKASLESILSAIEKIQRYTRGMSLEEFTIDEKTADAVMHNLSTLSYAAGRLPREFRDIHPEIDWGRLDRMELMLERSFFGPDLVIVWEAVDARIPELKARVEKILEA